MGTPSKYRRTREQWLAMTPYEKQNLVAQIMATRGLSDSVRGVAAAIGCISKYTANYWMNPEYRRDQIARGKQKWARMSQRERDEQNAVVRANYARKKEMAKCSTRSSRPVTGPQSSAPHGPARPTAPSIATFTL